MQKVYFHYKDRQLPIRHKKKVQNFISYIFKKEQKEIARLDYIFCSDNFLLELNRNFLNHDYYTDIITFDLSDNKAAKKGEIYISIDRVKDNAKTFHAPLTEESLRVIFHGALHLCGFRDKTKKETGVMRAKENFYLNIYKTNEQCFT